MVKEQYLRDLTEGHIIQEVHSPYELPGIIRISYFGYVKRKDGSNVECGLRKKVRLDLRDKRSLYMYIATPYGVLITAWDLLEGDRYTCTSNECPTDTQNQ